MSRPLKLWSGADVSKEELLRKLSALVGQDPEEAHARADLLLLEYIDDPAIADAFDAIDKWYA